MLDILRRFAPGRLLDVFQVTVTVLPQTTNSCWLVLCLIRGGFTNICFSELVDNCISGTLGRMTQTQQRRQTSCVAAYILATFPPSPLSDSNQNQSHLRFLFLSQSLLKREG